MDLKRDNPCYVAGVARDFAIALQRVHVSEIDPSALYLDRADQNRTGSHNIDVQVSVSAEFQLLRRDRVFVGRTQKE